MGQFYNRIFFAGDFAVAWNPYADNGSHAYTGHGTGHENQKPVGLPKNSWHHVKVTYYTTDATFSIWVDDAILHDRIKSDMNPGQTPERYTVYIASAGDGCIIEQYIDDITVSPVSRPYTITASAGEQGSISPSGAVTVNRGASQTFAITANLPYMIADVLVDGSSVGAMSTYTFTDVIDDHTIGASFSINASLLNQSSHSSSSSSGTSNSQAIVGLPNPVVTSATVSATKVAPGTPVMVNASVLNKGTANGAANIKLYINGQEETSKGITVNSGSNTPITFTVSRNEPGTYTVYVGGVSAGSFTVDEMADSNIILYISGALIFIALAAGAIYFLRRRQSINI